MVALKTLIFTNEEPHLAHQFGESYETYLRTVPRWLPRPPRADALPSNEQV